MTDIPQWRRKIPASRSRTPMLEVTEPEIENRPASAMACHPPTPKKGLRPKLSSYWSHNGPFGAAKVEAETPTETPVDEHIAPSFPSWAVEDPFPNPNAEQLIDSIMCRLMSGPYKPLDTRFNGMLLQIFEAYRAVSDGRDRAENRISEELCGRLADKAAMQHAEEKWDDEKLAYKAEVKRLELIIAKEKRGVAAVAQARQDSIIRRRKQMESPEDEDEDDGKETVIQFLEKTRRFEDPTWSSQRATMRTRPASPSMKMAKLSSKLNKKTSKTSIHADLADLPFGTPPEMPSTTSLQASLSEDQNARLATKVEESHANILEPRPSLSDDTQSTFSCAGDLLPDEIVERNHPVQAASVPALSTTEDEMTEIRQIAIAVSRRRGVSAESIMPRLVELFGQSLSTESSNRPDQQGLGISFPGSGQLKAPVRKASNIRGFINKLRPQLTLNTLSVIDRRFSFEVGDDGAAASTMEANPSSERERLLRKSVSLPSLPDAAGRRIVANGSADLSPVVPSPTSSECKRASKIPSPSYGANLARPRQNREDSMSSLLTAIKHSDQGDTARRAGSGASSVYSNATSASRAEQGKRHRGSGFSFVDAARESTHRHRVDHGGILPDSRSGPFRSDATAAAMKAMCNPSGTSEDDHAAERTPIHQQQKQRKRDRIAERSGPCVRLSKENARPVPCPSPGCDDDSRKGY